MTNDNYVQGHEVSFGGVDHIDGSRFSDYHDAHTARDLYVARQSTIYKILKGYNGESVSADLSGDNYCPITHSNPQIKSLVDSGNWFEVVSKLKDKRKNGHQKP